MKPSRWMDVNTHTHTHTHTHTQRAVSTVNYFSKRTTSQMFDWVENRLQAKELKY